MENEVGKIRTIIVPESQNLRLRFWKGQNVLSRFLLIRNHLIRGLGEMYADFLAEPLISPSGEPDKVEIRWLSGTVGPEAKPYEDLTDSEREIASQTIWEKLEEVKTFTINLRESAREEERELAELLLEVWEGVDCNNFYVDGGSVACVGWGCENLVDDTIEFVEEEAAVSHLESSSDLKTPKPIVDSEEDADVIESEEKQPPSKTRWGWRREVIYALMAVFLFVVGLFLFRSLSPTKNDFFAKASKIPPQLEESELKPDEDSITYLAAGKLNLAVLSPDLSVSLVGNDFVDAFPGEDYSVVYMDSSLQLPMLQIAVPAVDREEVKRYLKNRWATEEVAVMPELVRETRMMANDPDLHLADHSWHLQKVNAYAAWDQSHGDDQVTIAILDNGFDLSHPELNRRIFLPFNVRTQDQRVTSDHASPHGTHVAGIALGALNNGLGAAGIAPECRFMPIQVGNPNGAPFGTLAVMNGFMYALRNGADVINMSLGMKANKGLHLLSEDIQEELIRTTFKDEELVWQRLFSMAENEGVVVVLAGGNDKVLIGMDPMQRSPLTVNVSAVDRNNQLAEFSNYGRRSSISAPGVDIFSSVPGGKFEQMNGTSMAAPMVAGGIALLKSLHPNLGREDWLSMLTRFGQQPIADNKYAGKIMRFHFAEIDRPVEDRLPINRLPNYPIDPCPGMREVVDSLLQVIDRLDERNPEFGYLDTLNIPPADSGLTFASGRWRSTTTIVNNKTGERVELFFEFLADGQGQLTLVEANGQQCHAPLTLARNPGGFRIHQLREAFCPDGTNQYYPYHFTCDADSRGRAQCQARNFMITSNQFRFHLIRVR